MITSKGFLKNFLGTSFRLFRINQHSFSSQESTKIPVTEKIEWPKRVLSGIQPTGSMHMGNYLGAVKQWINLQDKGVDITIFIADLHSITLPQDPASMRHNILEMTASLLACGVDPDKTTLFLQSSVTRHAELCWILQCFTSMARLSHLPQYKEKTESMKEIPLGLFVYPVLQAADILLYKATHVPVGEDQIQHLQIAQQIVKTFNHRFGKTFPTPIAMLQDNAISKVKSLRDPLKKMSKSDPDPKSRILLTDSDAEINKKFRKAVSDFTPQITYDPESRPGVANMINIHSLLTNKIPEEICEESKSLNTLMYKSAVAGVVCEHIRPIREKIHEYLTQPQYLIEVLKKGAVKSNQRAEITFQEVYHKVGLGIPQLVEKNNLIRSII